MSRFFFILFFLDSLITQSYVFRMSLPINQYEHGLFHLLVVHTSKMEKKTVCINDTKPIQPKLFVCQAYGPRSFRFHRDQKQWRRKGGSFISFSFFLFFFISFEFLLLSLCGQWNFIKKILQHTRRRTKLNLLRKVNIYKWSVLYNESECFSCTDRQLLLFFFVFVLKDFRLCDIAQVTIWCRRWFRSIKCNTKRGERE